MRKLLAISALAAAALALSTPAAAGGWAVTSLDPMVAAPVEDEDVEVGFTIRQHGRTPVTVDDVAIVVTDANGGTTRFPAAPDGPVGHYLATIRLPAAGAYEWSVEQGWFGPQDLGTLDVAGSAAAAASGGGSNTSPLTTPLAVIAAALIGAGLFDLGRSTARRRAAA
jgi:hypothetical protein